VIWPFLLLAGVERVAIAPGDTAFTPLHFEHYPISHSLLTVILWGGLLGGMHYAARKQVRAALVLWALAVSHWLLDAVSHRPDMPLVPWSSTVVGLGLWSSVPATLVIECLMFAAGIGLYMRATRPRSPAGSYGLLALVVILSAFYLAAAFGPPPPSVQVLALSAACAPLLALFAAYVDRRRVAVG
jgi:membrane-bound metal-dependent hydrolase YbcI (DUF457 family)